MMRGLSPKTLEVRGGHFRLGYVLVAFLLLAAWAGSAGAQEGVRIPPPSPPPPPPPRFRVDGKPAPSGPVVTLAKPKDSGIVDQLSGPSSLIEIKVGQGRFLTLKEDLAAAGQPAPFLAVGDPTVADFFQVGPRQLRLIGKRLGTTDLTITTSSGKTYDYELQVIGDLSFLDAQLKKMFPDARLTLTQLREKIVVEGEARDAGEVMRILSVIDSYVRSIQRVMVPGQIGNVQNVIQGADPNAQVSGNGTDAQGFQNPAG
ncbi:pilus assembly protein N-terminal domain-containing protein, partial [Singulisphaera rosea]